jgi:serine/threonine-protein kinase
MGSVWVADHLGLHTQVAVKFIADDAAEDPMIKARFEREALAAAQLRSPHVVQIFDHGRTESGASYIAMELLDGETLGKRLMRLGALNARETVVIVGQVCRALSKAHAAGIVHRDIKPDNIFIIDSDGELFVKVLDFGIAKGATDQPLNVTSTGMAVGTPLYMSPEQSVSAKDVTFSTDLWAIAAVAYRCLVGQVPFKGSSFGALCLAINRGQFPPPTTLRPDLAPALDAWFARALALSTADRFASAREFSAQFSRAAGFSSGILISVPSGLPVRSTTGQQTALRVVPGRTMSAAPSGSDPTELALPPKSAVLPPLPVPDLGARGRQPLSAATVTIFPSDDRAAPTEEAAETVTPIAGATVNGRWGAVDREPGRSQWGVAMKFGATVALTASAVYAALFIGRAPRESSLATSGAALDAGAPASLAAPPASVAPDESEEIVIIDLGSSSGGSARPASRSAPAAAPAETPGKKSAVEGASSSAQRAACPSAKQHGRSSAPLPPTDTDLMEP